MLRRLVAASCLALAALAMGCAGSDPKPDVVADTVRDADYHDCESRAYVSTALIRSAGTATDKQEAIIDACMKEKGYRIQ